MSIAFKHIYFRSVLLYTVLPVVCLNYWLRTVDHVIAYLITHTVYPVYITCVAQTSVDCPLQLAYDNSCRISFKVRPVSTRVFFSNKRVSQFLETAFVWPSTARCLNLRSCKDVFNALHLFGCGCRRAPV